jgi:hypothetical protein
MKAAKKSTRRINHQTITPMPLARLQGRSDPPRIHAPTIPPTTTGTRARGSPARRKASQLFETTSVTAHKRTSRRRIRPLPTTRESILFFLIPCMIAPKRLLHSCSQRSSRGKGHKIITEESPASVSQVLRAGTSLFSLFVCLFTVVVTHDAGWCRRLAYISDFMNRRPK